ncbi:MAG: hypothetical protein KGZ25_09480 [Planctomycetes bacterium]|nr:hypothetical protein [Planctomycetota bacterium]
MTTRQRFLDVMHFAKPSDRLPMVEWAAWWNDTIDNWLEQGLPEDKSYVELQEYFGLDPMICISARAQSGDCPQPDSHGAPIIGEGRTYEEIRPYLFTNSIIENVIGQARELKDRHQTGEIIVRLWLDGYFWFPRKLLGIENHLYAFYDEPELMHRMNRELAEFNARVVDELFPVLKPDMVGFAEDMSYNNGPMLSQEQFEEFLTPYYQRVIPKIKDAGVKVLIDSDGDITKMIPWMQEAGIEGVYPLEKQAGVDIVDIRQNHPDFLMLGGYDKMVMSKGEAAMRAEFERLLPVMRSGGYVPSVDHQTPPGVSLENYRIYLRLFKEYAQKAAQTWHANSLAD